MQKINNFIYHGHGEAEPIGLEYIASSVIKAGFIKVQFISNRELRIKLNENKSVSLFSATTAEWNHVKELSFNAKLDGCITIIGGYHVCGKIEDNIGKYFDYVVVGEGELVIIDILKEIENGNYCKEDFPKIIESQRIVDLDSLPFPYRSTKYLGNYVLYDLMYPSPSMQVNPGIVLASRGCSYDCSFCASSSVWGRGLRLRSPENVVEELFELKEKFNSNTFVFIDQSFGQNKNWAFDLLKLIIDSRLKLNWYHQSNITINPELIAVMAEAGCKKIGFGIEGISPYAIKMLKPPNPQNLDKINSLLDYCNSLGIFTKAYLMLGFPWENKDVIEEYFTFLTKLNANQIKLSFFTPFLGTKDWDIYSNNLVSKNWDDFDTVKMPVIYNPNISVDDYIKIRQDLFNEFYSSNNYINLTNTILNRFPNYERSYQEFFEYLLTFDMIKDVEGFNFLNFERGIKKSFLIESSNYSIVKKI